MGIPKFYRYLSERYPQINEIVTSPQYLPSCDYLYLDLNGVIHNATHGDSITQGVRSDESVAVYIMGYICNIFKQIQPKKLLFIAVDGVAPRAKLNQQRSRRYRAALDAQKEAIEQDYHGKVFDSNCITPGTEFMFKVDKILEYMIHKMISEDPLWRKTKVIYSSHSDPGEGEHKIMKFIRGLVTDPDYNSNERHCIYGLDADLILLSLSLHDVNIILLREIINFFSFANNKEIDDRAVGKSTWQVLHIAALRNYLLYDLTPLDSSWMGEIDKERLIDDFVFLMILLGDDFLPELPSLDINEGSIQLIVDLYKAIISKVHGFLIEDAKPVLSILQILFSKLGDIENDVFRERKKIEADRRHRDSGRRSSPPTSNPKECIPGGLPIIKTDAYMLKELGNERYHDFRHYYYFDKLNVKLPENESVLNEICHSYYEGLQWIYSYYYRGVVSWSWYYPYHYAPLASDLARYHMVYSSFILHVPYTPFMQQLGCLPPQSSSLLPHSYQSLVLEDDSPIIQFYPPEFAIDMNNKVNPWEGVNLIPFIDEDQLKNAVLQFHCDENLTDEEKERNTFKPARLFMYSEKTRDMGIVFHPPFVSPMLPNVKDCCSVYIFHFPEPRGKQENVLHLKTLPGTSCLDLKSHPENISKNSIHILCTGRIGKQPTICITIPPRVPLKQLTHQILLQLADNCAMRLVTFTSQTRYGRIEGLYTPNHCMDLTVAMSQPRSLPSDEKEAINDLMQRMVSEALVGRMDEIGVGGTQLDEIPILAVIRPIIGMRRDPVTATLTYRYASDVLLLPLQVVTPVDRICDPHLMAKPNQSLAERLAPNDKVVFLGTNKIDKNCAMGGIGVVERIEKNKAIIRLESIPLNIGLGHKVLNNVKQEKWYSIDELRSILGLSARGILKIAGYYPVYDSDGNKRNIGLRFCDRNHVIPRKSVLKYVSIEYAQCRLHSQIRYSEKQTSPLPFCPIGVPYDSLLEPDTSYLKDINFSNSALHILMNYKNHFPQVFIRIRDSDSSSSLDDLFYGDSAFLRQVEKYVKELPHHHEARMDIESICATPKQASLLAKAGYIMASESSKSMNCVLECSANQIAFWERDGYTASLTECYSVVPAIGDRVVIIGGNDLPIGSYGFVVAVHPTSHRVELVMDKQFIGGTNLLNLLDVNYRGANVAWEQCLFIKEESKRVGPAKIIRM